MAGLPPITIPAQEANLGLEVDLWAYVGHLVAIFRELRRALRDDSCLWINLGDSYGSSVPDGLKQKNLLGIPWRVAFALQSDGWYLRSDVIWSKPNPMPESVTDRPTKAHEYIFLLSKSKRYYYDAEAVREKSDMSSGWHKQRISNNHHIHEKPAGTVLGRKTDPHGGLNKSDIDCSTRNRRSVWEQSTQPYPDAHFAVWPEKLVEPMILASTSERGCCAGCGSPYERIIDKQSNYEKREQAHVPGNSNSKVDSSGWNPPTIEHRGWQPTCKCDTTEVTPAIVLDPFIGSGTTGRVAIKHRRNFIGFELNETYAEDLASDRLNGVQIRMV